MLYALESIRHTPYATKPIDTQKMRKYLSYLVLEKMACNPNNSFARYYNDDNMMFK